MISRKVKPESEPKVFTGVYIPESLRHWLQVYAATERTTQSAVVEELLRKKRAKEA